MVDVESANGSLLGLQALKDHLAAMSTNRKPTETSCKGPTPMIMQAAQSQESHRDEEWKHFPKTAESVQYAKGIPDDAEAQQHMHAMHGKGSFKDTN